MISILAWGSIIVFLSESSLVGRVREAATTQEGELASNFGLKHTVIIGQSIGRLLCLLCAQKRGRQRLGSGCASVVSTRNFIEAGRAP